MSAYLVTGVGADGWPNTTSTSGTGWATLDEAKIEAHRLVATQGRPMSIYELTLVGTLEPVKEPVRWVPAQGEACESLGEVMGAYYQQERGVAEALAKREEILTAIAESPLKNEIKESIVHDGPTEPRVEETAASNLSAMFDEPPRDAHAVLVEAHAKVFGIPAEDEIKLPALTQAEVDEIEGRKAAKVVVDDYDPFAELASQDEVDITRAAEIQPQVMRLDPQAGTATINNVSVDVSRHPHTDPMVLLARRVGDCQDKCPRCNGPTHYAPIAFAGNLQYSRIRICSDESCAKPVVLCSECTSPLECDATGICNVNEMALSDAPKPFQGPGLVDPAVNPPSEPALDDASATILACRYDKDLDKCPRCGKWGSNSLIEGEMVRYCLNPECRAKMTPVVLDSASGLVRPAQEGETPHGVAEALARRAAILEGINKDIDLIGTIPDESEIETDCLIFGVTVALPPVEWLNEPITEIREDGAAGGQLKALNAGLTEIGYGGKLRHKAALAILGQAYGSLARSVCGSLKELSKGEASLILDWLSKKTPEAIAAMKDGMSAREVML